METSSLFGRLAVLKAGCLEVVVSLGASCFDFEFHYPDSEAYNVWINIDLNTRKLLAATQTFYSNSEKVAIDIKSDVFISVVARNKITLATDAYLAIPLTYAANDYYVISFCFSSLNPLCHVGVVPVTETT